MLVLNHDSEDVAFVIVLVLVYFTMSSLESPVKTTTNPLVLLKTVIHDATRNEMSDVSITSLPDMAEHFPDDYVLKIMHYLKDKSEASQDNADSVQLPVFENEHRRLWPIETFFRKALCTSSMSLHPSSKRNDNDSDNQKQAETSSASTPEFRIVEDGIFIYYPFFLARVQNLLMHLRVTRIVPSNMAVLEALTKQLKQYSRLRHLKVVLWVMVGSKADRDGLGMFLRFAVRDLAAEGGFEVEVQVIGMAQDGTRWVVDGVEILVSRGFEAVPMDCRCG